MAKINGDLTVTSFLDLSKQELRNVRVQNLAADPSSPVAGQMYYNTVTNKRRTFNGTTWDESIYTAGTGGGGTGDVVGPAASVDNELPLFSATTGKLLKRATFSGLLKGTTGVVSAAVAGTDYLAPAGSGAALTGITVGQVSGAAPLASPALTGTPTAPTAAAATNTTQVATTAFVTAANSGIIASADALVFKGGIDGSANPNYPAADAGWLYRITVAGRIGGAAGAVVQVGDTVTCAVDATASGDQATVGGNWIVTQTNLDAASTTVAGYTTYATQAESFAQTVATKAVTPVALVGYLRSFTANFGDAAATSFTITHNLGTKNVKVTVYLNATDAEELAGSVVASTTNTVTVSGWTTAPAASAYRAVVMG